MAQHYYIIGQILSALERMWRIMLNCRRDISGTSGSYRTFYPFLSVSCRRDDMYRSVKTAVGLGVKLLSVKDKQNKNRMVAKSCGKRFHFPNHLLAKAFSFSCSSASKSKALPISVTISALM